MRDVLVTGASGGIGSAVASVLASSGHRVIAIGRDSGRLERLSSSGAKVITADLARVGELRAAVREIGHLDALIHCAGVSAVASVADTDPATWHDLLTVNVTAAAELTRILLPALRRSRGHVIFVNASPGMRAVPRWAAFVGQQGRATGAGRLAPLGASRPRGPGHNRVSRRDRDRAAAQHQGSLQPAL